MPTMYVCIYVCMYVGIVHIYTVKTTHTHQGGPASTCRDLSLGDEIVAVNGIPADRCCPCASLCLSLHLSLTYTHALSSRLMDACTCTCTLTSLLQAPRQLHGDSKVSALIPRRLLALMHGAFPLTYMTHTRSR
jgi:hypothetical protein